MAGRNVLITGSIHFEDATSPAPLADEAQPGGGSAPSESLFEYGGLSIQVVTGGIPSKHRAVVSSEGRFGFRVPVPDEESTVARVEITKDGYAPVVREALPIGDAGPDVGPVADVGEARLAPT